MNAYLGNVRVRLRKRASGSLQRDRGLIAPFFFLEKNGSRSVISILSQHTSVEEKVLLDRNPIARKDGFMRKEQMIEGFAYRQARTCPSIK